LFSLVQAGRREARAGLLARQQDSCAVGGFAGEPPSRIPRCLPDGRCRDRPHAG